MTRLRTKGLIELINHREIVIPDVKRLQEAAYEAPAGRTWASASSV
jgi:CRP/FNR family transcriptional regulator, anaerobic regulatory protein